MASIQIKALPLEFHEAVENGSDHGRTWFDDTNQYRITWCDQAFGVSVKSRFHACVLCVRDGFVSQASSLKPQAFLWWDFAWQRRPFRTFEAAEKACQRNFRVWSRLMKLSQAAGRRDKRLNALDERFDLRGRGLPVWVSQACDPGLLSLLTGRPRQSAETKNMREASARLKRKVA